MLPFKSIGDRVFDSSCKRAATALIENYTCPRAPVAYGTIVPIGTRLVPFESIRDSILDSSCRVSTTASALIENYTCPRASAAFSWHSQPDWSKTCCLSNQLETTSLIAAARERQPLSLRTTPATGRLWPKHYQPDWNETCCLSNQLETASLTAAARYRQPFSLRPAMLMRPSLVR